MVIDPQAIIAGLMQRGVPRAAAIGIAGNMAVESGFDPGINEVSPTVEGSRGGYGLIQWTGPRRRQLEEYAGGKTADLNTQLDFLVQELGTTERSAAKAIYAAKDPVEAARLVSERFLRPGIPHMERRIEETQRLAGMASPQTQEPQRADPQAPDDRMNRLAVMQRMMPTANALDPSAFQTQQAPTNALMGFGAGNNPFVRK